MQRIDSEGRGFRASDVGLQVGSRGSISSLLILILNRPPEHQEQSSPEIPRVRTGAGKWGTHFAPESQRASLRDEGLECDG
jgi:hypothetical protein